MAKSVGKRLQKAAERLRQPKLLPDYSKMSNTTLLKAISVAWESGIVFDEFNAAMKEARKRFGVTRRRG